MSDTITTAEELEALRCGAVVIAASGGVFHKQRADYWTKADDTSEQWTHYGVAECHRGPFTVLLDHPIWEPTS